MLVKNTSFVRSLRNHLRFTSLTSRLHIISKTQYVSLV